MRLAVHHRDRFGVLARPRQAEAQVGLDGLQAVGGADQRAAEHEPERCAHARVQEGGEHHVAVHRDRGPRQRCAARHAQQDVDEAAQDQQREQQRVGERDRHVGGDADVLGDAAVRVVVFASGELQAVEVAVRQPVLQQQVGEPASPVELQPALDVHVQRGHPHGEGEDQHEDPHQLQQLGQRAILQGVEEIAVPVAHPDRQPDLRHRQQHQRQHRRAHLPLALAVPVAPRQQQEAPSAVTVGRPAVGLLGKGGGVGGGHGAIMPRYGQFVRGGRRGLPAAGQVVPPWRNVGAVELTLQSLRRAGFASGPAVLGRLGLEDALP